MSWPFTKLRKKSCNEEVIVNVIDESYVENFCIDWSIKFPIDRWWRQKHNVAFNSAAHRELSLWDMRFEFEEFLLFEKNKHLSKYDPTDGEWLRAEMLIDDDSDLTQEERAAKYKKEFSKIDLSQYNDE
jgi:hypothetical protein